MSMFVQVDNLAEHRRVRLQEEETAYRLELQVRCGAVSCIHSRVITHHPQRASSHSPQERPRDDDARQQVISHSSTVC